MFLAQSTLSGEQKVWAVAETNWKQTLLDLFHVDLVPTADTILECSLSENENGLFKKATFLLKF